MRIEFVRTGGFAGLRLAASLETGQVPLDEAEKLEKLVTDCAFFELKRPQSSSVPLPDSFEYQVKISSSLKTHTIVMSESDVPDSLRPLLNYLTSLAITKNTPYDF